MIKQLFFFVVFQMLSYAAELDPYLHERYFSPNPIESIDLQGSLSESQRRELAAELYQLSHIKRIAEIGSCAGIFPEVFLENCPDAEVISFDRCHDPYTKLAVACLSQKYPTRFTVIEDDFEFEDSAPVPRDEKEKFDLIVINERESSSTCFKYIENLRPWANQNTLLWIHNDPSAEVMKAIQRCEKEGLIKVIKSNMIDSASDNQAWIKAQYAFHTESEQEFSKIYKLGIWGKNSEGEGTSGNGSTVTAGLPFVTYVEDFLKSRDIGSILDLGCGDWVLGKEIQWGDRIYTGIDIVPDLIIKNRALYASNTIRFLNLDILSDPLPEADLLICKDVLMHLPLSDIFKMLNKMKKYQYCIIVNDFFPLWNAQNSEIKIGEYRPLGLMSPPFNLNPDAMIIYDAGGYYKQLVLIQNQF